MYARFGKHWYSLEHVAAEVKIKVQLLYGLTDCNIVKRALNIKLRHDFQVSALLLTSCMTLSKSTKLSSCLIYKMGIHNSLGCGAGIR